MDYLTRGFVSKETLVLHQWRIIDSLTNESTKFFNSFLLLLLVSSSYLGVYANTTSTAARTSSENVTSHFCNHFLIIQSHYACKMCSNYPGIKL